MSVSERIQSLESGSSGATTFYSAMSRLSELPVVDSACGTSQPSRASFFSESLISAHSRKAPLLARNDALETVEEPDDNHTHIFGLPLYQTGEDVLDISPSEPV